VAPEARRWVVPSETSALSDQDEVGVSAELPALLYRLGHQAAWCCSSLMSHVRPVCWCVLCCAVLCADAFKRLGLSPPRGVLLHGPPGCSKTMLARAAATGSKATFIPLSCAQVCLWQVLSREHMPSTHMRCQRACQWQLHSDTQTARATQCD
jgi:hypothetical protein